MFCTGSLSGGDVTVPFSRGGVGGNKMTFCNFTAFLYYFYTSNPLFFGCFSYGVLAYLCQNMINIDAADFRKRRSKGVRSFF